MSGAVRELQRTGVVSFETGDDHLAEIEFDHASQARALTSVRYCRCAFAGRERETEHDLVCLLAFRSHLGTQP